MNATRDPDAILNAWLDEGPTDLPDATRRAILTSLPTTPQARRGPFAPWRYFPMNTYARLAAAAVVAVIAIGALYLIGPRNGIGGPGPSPTLTIAPSPSATPGPTPDISAWTPFSSTVFGFDARYPVSWRLEPGTVPASLANVSSGDRQFFDHFVAPSPAVVDTEMYGTSSLLPAGMSEDAWVTAYRQPVVDQFGPRCFPSRDQWEPVTVNGHPGGLYVGCNYVESTTFVNGRAYIFTYVLPMGSQPGADEVGMLRALISTVTLHPERAVMPSPAPS